MIEEDINSSSEILRLTLPFISKHGTDFSPMSYAIWYEYVRGANADLRRDIDAAIKLIPKLSFEKTFELYHSYIADASEKALGKTKTGVIELIGRLSGEISTAGEGTMVFSEHLASFHKKISQPNNSQLELQASVGEISTQVTNIGSTLNLVQKELATSHAKIQKLTDELNKVREESFVDALSQLKNRRAYEMALVDSIIESRASGEPLSVILFDIDLFKKINDTYGHLFGDQVIRIFSQILKRNVKGKDVVARYGGEEFVVLLPSTPLAGAIAVANQIRGLIEHGRIKKPNSQETIGSITISAGVAQLTANDDASTLVERADRGLYEAKANGRNKVCSASASNATVIAQQVAEV